MLVEGKDLKIIRIKEKEDFITWYFSKRTCADCNGEIKFEKQGYEMVCDNCQEDIGARATYKCSNGCKFAVCGNCAECRSRHELYKAKGKPPSYRKERKV